MQNEPNFLERNQHLAAPALAAPAVTGGTPSSLKTMISTSPSIMWKASLLGVILRGRCARPLAKVCWWHDCRLPAGEDRVCMHSRYLGGCRTEAAR